MSKPSIVIGFVLPLSMLPLTLRRERPPRSGGWVQADELSTTAVRPGPVRAGTRGESGVQSGSHAYIDEVKSEGVVKSCSGLRWPPQY